MKSLRVSVLALSFGCCWGCATGQQLPIDQIQSPGHKVFNGYDTQANCYSCHDGTGRGHPDLSKRVPELSDEELLNAINEGPGHMPSFRDKLSEDEKRQLVQWLRQEFGGEQAATSDATTDAEADTPT